MAFEIRYYNANSNKDDIEFVTEFPCLLGHIKILMLPSNSYTIAIWHYPQSTYNKNIVFLSKYVYKKYNNKKPLDVGFCTFYTLWSSDCMFLIKHHK